MELERRWKVNINDIPKYKAINILHITQVYSSFDPDVRIRKTESDDSQIIYTHTVKYFLTNNKREEFNQDIEKKSYDNIFEYINKKPVIKDRYIIPYDNYKIEVDIFKDVDKAVAEIEFSNENEMNNFNNIPMWFGNEIKDRQSYSVKLFNLINDETKAMDLLLFKLGGDINVQS